MTTAPRVTRSYKGKLGDARKSMQKDAADLAKQGYALAEEAWEPADQEQRASKHKSHGILWKMTHPVGATLGMARFVGATAISALPKGEKGTLTATFERPSDAP